MCRIPRLSDSSIMVSVVLRSGVGGCYMYPSFHHSSSETGAIIVIVSSLQVGKLERREVK